MGIKITGGFFRLTTYFLFFLMFVFPMVLELLYVKAAIFGLLFCLCVISTIKRGYLHLHPEILQLTLFMLFVGIFFSIEGLIAGTPGALKQAQVYVLWPLIYLILITSLKESEIIVGLQRTIIISTIFLSLYGIVHVLAILSILPGFFMLSPFKSEVIAFGYKDGYMEMTIPGINSLAFLVPYCMAALVPWLPGTKDYPVNRKLIWAALILSLIFSLLTARKAVWLVIILSPVIIFSFRLLSDPHVRIKRRLKENKLVAILFIFCSIVIASYVFITSIYNFDLIKIISDFFSGFSFMSKNEPERYEQFFALIRGWWVHPLFGSGLGATAAQYGSIRSISSPWSYELYYLALLFQVGLVGLILYAGGVIWTYFQGYRMIKSGTSQISTIMPFFVGMTCMLIAGATNPLFIRFDGIWFFFLPLALINNWMLNRK
jgi:O-antigen ligase